MLRRRGALRQGQAVDARIGSLKQILPDTCGYCRPGLGGCDVPREVGMGADAGSAAETVADQGLAALDVFENLADQPRLLYTSNHPQSSTAVRAGLNIDCKHLLEALHPSHGGGWLVRVDLVEGLARHDTMAVFEVGCEYLMETSQVESRARHQCGESRHEVQLLQYHMR